MAVDGAVVAIMLAAGLAGFWPVFGGPSFIRAAVIGLVAGAVVAWLGTWGRWMAGIVALGTVVAYLALGTVAAVPAQGIVQVVPTGISMRTIVLGSVHVWREFVTASTPLGDFVGFTLVPFMVALIGAVVAFSLVWRVKRAWLALIPVGAVLVAVIALGVTHAFFPTVQALVVGVVAIGWLAWRPQATAASEPPHVRRNRLRNSAILLAIAGVVASVSGPAMASAVDRDVIRAHTVPPLDLRAYPSPLAAFRSLVDKQAEDTLFTVTGWKSGYRLRLAVMDSYDGMVYNVGTASGASRYDRVGPDLGQVGTTATGDAVQCQITVGTYADVWVPGVSTNDAVRFTSPRSADLANALYYNPLSDAMVDTLGLAPGDVFTIDAVPTTRTPTKSTPLEPVSVPKPALAPDAVADLASTWAAEAGTPYDRVDAIVTRLHDNGFYSDGGATQEPSLPGHSAARIADLLKKPQRMIGDDEQYAVTAALMLQSLGIPARVVMGFYTSDQSELNGTTWTVKGSDVHAWIEVPFQGFGWVPFTPTPEKDQVPTAETQRSRTQPRPQVLQPPPAINNDDQAQTRNQAENQTSPNKDKKDGLPWQQIMLYAGLAAIPLVLLFGPMLVIGWLKARRTLVRRLAADPSARLSGGWQEVLDRAADMGAVVPKAATRRQASAVLQRRFKVDGVRALADTADAGTFGPVPPTPALTDGYWSAVGGVTAQMRRGLSLWNRYKARLSLASLRKHPTATISLEEA